MLQMGPRVSLYECKYFYIYGAHVICVTKLWKYMWFILLKFKQFKVVYNEHDLENENWFQLVLLIAIKLTLLVNWVRNCSSHEPWLSRVGLSRVRFKYELLHFKQMLKKPFDFSPSLQVAWIASIKILALCE